ncbi:SNW/SKI-interacting protein [Raphanus sativus]|nr:SNW/SKI-interacting protein [Raphanus sativus]
MASPKSLPPPPAKSTTTSHDHSNAPWFKNRFTGSENPSAAFEAEAAYRKRQGYYYPEDLGDGGAFPEIHVVQYPLGMGKNNNNKSNKHESNTLPVTVDVEGNVVFDAIVKQKNKIVYSQHKDITPKVLKKNEEELQKQIHETTEETKAAIDKVVNGRLSGAQDSKCIKYEPSSSAFKERVIRMVEMAVDPLDPPKFKHKRVPKPSGSPPVPVLHSPPRPVTVKDQQDWKIPPCISDWKNQKGYAIPLDKRVAAADGGRGLQDVRINDGFAKLAECMYAAEEKAREAVSMRSKVRKEMVMMENERREQELKALAQKARSERERDEPKEREGRMRREKIRGERKLEATGKKSKISRDRDRDVSERVALGMARTGGKGGEVTYDQRLFNQEKGMDSGFSTDDQYNVYDKGLFTAQQTLSTLYKPKKDTDEEMYGNVADEQLDRLKNTERFKPDKGFTGASERSGKRERPVEFEKEDERDPLGEMEEGFG